MLSVEEVARLLEAVPGIKYRAALGVAYGTGLRVSEVAHLKADDIDSKRMLIRIEEGTSNGLRIEPLHIRPPDVIFAGRWDGEARPGRRAGDRDPRNRSVVRQSRRQRH